MSKKAAKLNAALDILRQLDLPPAQQNERSALCLLALCNLSANTNWRDAGSPLLGITPIMEWMKLNYDKTYKPNSRETIRRSTIHQFCDAGIAIYNPDKPERPVNSPKAVYQLSPAMLNLVQCYGSSSWKITLESFLVEQQSLVEKYAQARDLARIPVQIASNKEIRLTPGEHSELIRDVIVSFAPNFAPDAQLIYVGDTEDKWGYFDQVKLSKLGVEVNSHGKMPDVVLHYTAKNWLLLVEAVTSHGPVDGKRHAELAHLFKHSAAGLVYVTAFPSKPVMARYLAEIAWESEVWVADAPTHLIHFNGERFLGPYGEG